MVRGHLATLAFFAVGGVTAQSSDCNDVVSLVQRNVGIFRSAPSPVPAPILVQSNIGRTADFDEDGYNQVVEITKSVKNREQMSIYVKRFCEAEGLTISDDESLEAFEKYFDGECASQSFSALYTGLHEAVKKPSACGGGWIKEDADDDGDYDAAGQKPTSLLAIKVDRHQRAAATAAARSVLRKVQEARNPNPKLQGADIAYNATAASKNDEAMKAFIRGTIAVLGGEVLDEANFSGFVRWYSGTNATQSFENLKKELYQAPWVELPRLEVGRSVPAGGGEADPLNEHGYESIAKSNNRDRMAVFIHRVLDQEGLRVLDESKLSGMIPWYTAECGPQSYAALRAELVSVARPSAANVEQGLTCGGWLSDA